jgi:hypothetical protein
MYSILTGALDRGEWWALSSSRFIPGTRCVGGWVGSRSDLDPLEKRKICWICRESNSDCLFTQLAARSLPNPLPSPECTCTTRKSGCCLGTSQHSQSLFSFLFRLRWVNPRTTRISQYLYSVLSKSVKISSCILEAYGSNLGGDTCYCDSGFSGDSTVPLCKCRDCTSI